uniref:Chorein N-terminal domain-containing protein n=1 Tax=Caenorhabditis japonica TaxID=281687 RepID=A0A8R1E5I1_CAEJA
MVFESLVADLLNRFLGDFVDNLDSSQLNIGIWGGDVKLDNLQVKETALDDFDLPIKLKYGYLSSLVLKIPWKNLYNEPVIATIDGLNLIVVPNKGVVYSEEKALKNLQEIKQKTLARLEEARKERRKPKDPQADTFAEKMVTQIIKNLQVSVSNIHVRFEDRYTNRHRPFAMGVTLEKLDFKTTDENWKETIHKDVVKIIYKLVSLQNLAVYWNSSAEFISDLDNKETIRKKLQETIHNGKNRPIGYKYILEPIQMEAKLKLNQKPETDGSNWTIPKIDLAVDMHSLSLAIGKFQYQDVLLFLEAQERFNAASQYLKYRPNLNEFKGHYKTWWRFAYTAILEEKVRRRRNNWSWDRMKKHRDLVKKYQKAWVRRQTEASPGAEVEATIKEAEKKLDVFNVNVARQQAEMDIDRQGLTRQEDKPQGWVAWGKSWFGGGGPEQSADAKHKKDGKDIGSQFQAAMTPEEKSKLFEAIDYQENIPPTNYPKEFVENKFEFKLGQVAIVVDGAISMQLLQLKANVEQRPSAGAMHVESSIQQLRMDGCGSEVIRVRDPSIPWMSFLLDTNPLKGDYDQLVKLAIAPINIKYQAAAINNAIDVFKPPESVRLNQLTALAMSRYEEVKTRSVTGLAHAVEHRSRLVLDVQIYPARVYISEGGSFNAEKPTLLADMGLLSVVTVDTSSVKTDGMDKLSALMEKAYDRFHVKLSNVVIAFADNVDTAEKCVFQKESPLHVLKPTGLDIQIHKSSIDDLRLAKMRVIGDLPDIVVGISDVRLIGLMKLALSIPTPKPDEKTEAEKKLEEVPVAKIKDRAKMRTIMEAEEMEEDETQKEEEEEGDKKKKTSEQQVQIELDLRLNQIGVIVYRKDAILCDVSILKMACKLQMRTFDMVVTAELGSIRVSLPEFNSLDSRRPHLYLIDNDELEGALMTLKFVQANPESPFFHTEYHSTEQAIDFTFTKLAVSLHQEGVLELKAFGEALQAQLNELQKDKPEGEKLEETARKISKRLSESVLSIASAGTEKEKKQRKKTVAALAQEADTSRNIKQKIKASFGSLSLLIGTQKSLETSLAIENINAKVKMTEKAMEVVATLRAISMEDCTQGAVYKKLLSVTGSDDMLRFDFVQYQRNDAQRALMHSSDVDMVVKMRLAQMRFVFLNLWLARLMAWIAPFQNEAVRAAQAAQAAAAEKAATAAQNVKQIMEQSPPRIQLDVILEAPFIVVPRLSTSRDVIVLHLGRLAVKVSRVVKI